MTVVAERLDAVYRSTHVDRASENRALLDAIDLVTERLVSEPRVNFGMLSELEELRQEVERDLRSGPIPSPEDVRQP